MPENQSRLRAQAAGTTVVLDDFAAFLECNTSLPVIPRTLANLPFFPFAFADLTAEESLLPVSGHEADR